MSVQLRRPLERVGPRQGAPGPERSAPRASSRRRRPRWLVYALVFAAVGVLAAGAGLYLGTRPKPESPGQLMHLSPVPRRPAPGFTLTDQHGQARSLASFHGKPVALYFMDPQCHDVCPIVAQEFRAADHDLGRAARRVALVGIDVNPNATAVHFVRTFDAEHGLNRLHNWYYLTGTLAMLKSVWEHYTITVQVAKTGTVAHTTLIDFISRHGIEHAMAVPTAEIHHNGTGYWPAGDISEFGQGIANQLRALL